MLNFVLYLHECCNLFIFTINSSPEQPRPVRPVYLTRVYTVQFSCRWTVEQRGAGKTDKSAELYHGQGNVYKRMFFGYLIRHSFEKYL